MYDFAHALPGCFGYDCCIHESLSNPPNESNPVNGSKDANWFALEQSAKSGNVVPIIGPDALMVEYAGKTLPFYRLIAAELLASFQLDPDPKIVKQTWCLHHAVSEILRHAPGVEQRISRQIRLLVDQYSNAVQPAKSLCLLANIPTFTLYISLTPDNLLQQAMQRSDPSTPVRVIEFSPRSASESIADLTLPPPGERVIFQMLGSCSNGGIGFAIHEEHVLEYCYHLQTEAARRFTDILSGLRRRDKLLIHCNFPDWLGRSLLRLVTNERLYVADKTTQEFLCPHADDKGLHTFLTQFSPDGKHIVSGSWDNTLRLWEIFEGWTDALCQKLGLNMTPSEWREWVSPDITYRKVCLKFPEPSDESTFSE